MDVLFPALGTRIIIVKAVLTRSPIYPLLETTAVLTATVESVAVKHVVEGRLADIT